MCNIYAEEWTKAQGKKRQNQDPGLLMNHYGEGDGRRSSPLRGSRPGGSDEEVTTTGPRAATAGYDLLG